LRYRGPGRALPCGASRLGRPEAGKAAGAFAAALVADMCARATFGACGTRAFFHAVFTLAGRVLASHVGYYGEAEGHP